LINECLTPSYLFSAFGLIWSVVFPSILFEFHFFFTVFLGFLALVSPFPPTRLFGSYCGLPFSVFFPYCNCLLRRSSAFLPESDLAIPSGPDLFLRGQSFSFPSPELFFLCTHPYFRSELVNFSPFFSLNFRYLQ